MNQNRGVFKSIYIKISMCVYIHIVDILNRFKISMLVLYQLHLYQLHAETPNGNMVSIQRQREIRREVNSIKQ